MPCMPIWIRRFTLKVPGWGFDVSPTTLEHSTFNLERRTFNESICWMLKVQGWTFDVSPKKL